MARGNNLETSEPANGLRSGRRPSCFVRWSWSPDGSSVCRHYVVFVGARGSDPAHWSAEEQPANGVFRSCVRDARFRRFPPPRMQASAVPLDNRGGVLVGTLRLGAVWRRPHRDGVRVPVTRTPGGLAKRLGRAVLWLLVLVLLLRGLASVMEPRRPAAVAAKTRPVAAGWPGDEGRAFAADCARAFLTYSPRDPDAAAAAMRAFVAPEIASSVVPEYGENAPRQAVGSVSVARVARID